MSRRLVALAVFALVVTACGDAAAPEEGRLKVVTTVAPITDIAGIIAGPDVEVVGIVPQGVDSHTYEPSPAVAEELSDARLFIANGLFLEEPSLQLAEASLPEDAEILELADRVVTPEEWVFDFTFPEEEGIPNPHLWTSPPLAKEYARLIAEKLAEIDREHADAYQARYQGYAQQLDELDAAIFAAVETVPVEQRKLVTYHDSFPYFAPRYGLEIVGAIQPSDFSEPSAAEVRELIDQIRDLGVPAIFGSEVFPSDVLEVIAEETGADYVEDLRDDELPGEPGDPEHSYVGMMIFNVRTIVAALGGDPFPLDAMDPAPPGIS